MSPYPHYEIARARQQEIVSRAINSHRSDSRGTPSNRRRGVKYRLVQLVAVLGVCGAAGTAVTVSAAQSNQRPVKQQHVHVSARRLARWTPRARGQGLRAGGVHREWDADAQLQHRSVGDSQVVAAARSPRAASWGLGAGKRGARPHRPRPTPVFVTCFEDPHQMRAGPPRLRLS